MIEISSYVSDKPNRILEWANAVKYNSENLSAEDKEMSAAFDAWMKEVGRTGYDRDHELSAFILNTFTPDAVEIPSDVLDAMFDYGNISEFDDEKIEVAPKNTFVVHNGAFGGNVDRSFVDHKYIAPTWKHLQVETDIPLTDIRRGGFRTVANVVSMINEAMEFQRLSTIIDLIDSSITSGNDNYISEASAAPTETSASALALYLGDHANAGMPTMFGRSKYIHAINGLTGTTSFLTDARKDMYSHNGLITEYQGCTLRSIPSTVKVNGSLVMPDKRVFGAAGKIGKITNRGSVNVYQETDINSEKIHIKVNGYQFGVSITDGEKVAKIVMAQ